ncbi:MAG TPA: gamma-glutamylcyclotransferase [Patescibacteria group bacterium]|nr:gamma-glutamylcyclotransferase [Patescibacteria group bacterium]
MDGNFWVFGYGSLIWRPGFEFEESTTATLHGWHRAMCILSTLYRGSAREPGLVLGLDRGGSCRGVAFRIAAGKAEAIRQYLYDREMITQVYTPRFAPLRLADGRRVSGYLFTARRDHVQYSGPLSPDQAVALIRQGAGSGGTCRDYLASTVEHLERLGIRDAALARLLHRVDAP